jgi:lipoprotein-anchoring transpeptidase ErfK/SrfK
VWVCVALAAVAIVAVRLSRRGETTDAGAGSSPAAVAVPAAVAIKPPPDVAGAGGESRAAAPERTDTGMRVAALKALVEKGDLTAAREEAFAALGSCEADAGARAIEALLGDVNARVVFSAAQIPEKTNHTVRAGDRLEAIARKYGATMDLLQACNGIKDPARIRIGSTLRVMTGVWRVDVLRRSNELVLSLNGRFFKRYTIGTGKHEKTPLGAFVVAERVREPVWWHPDGRQIPFGKPENILGTRWLALKATGDTPEVKGYGIHGTWDDSTIGKSESAGCVRMANRDVEELFTLVPAGTVVRIVDK